jgi:Holliday junction DNA helicase RuvA
LKGKIQKSKNSSSISAVVHNTIPEDALIALVNLGINKAMAENAINKINNISSLSVEDIIKQALRAL